MYRIDDNQNVANLPAPPTDNVGTPGFFTGGNPGASPPVPPTRVRFWWLNLVQESLMALLSATGLAPSKTDSTLVLQGVSIIGRRAQVWTTPGTYSWTVPAGVYRLKVTVIGGGGPGGYSTNWASGGGGSGGRAIKWLAVTPGQVISVTVGAGGLTPTTGGGSPTPAGTSSFGTFVSATGGGAGAGGATVNAGGPPGVGVGGDFNDFGSYGGDSIPLGQRGGDGGGPGNGRGTTNYFTGLDAVGFGGGGGGGGSSQVNGGGAGASGGSGKSGAVFVEY